jgi:hypothetical protein
MNSSKRTNLSEIPAFILEQAILGELPAAEQRVIEALPGYAEHKARVEADNAAILAAYPVDGQVRTIRDKATGAAIRAWTPEVVRAAPRTGAVWMRFSALAVPVAAAALFALLLIQPGRELALAGTDPADAIRVKGQAGADAGREALQASRMLRLAELRARAGLAAPTNAAEALTISVRSAKELIRSIMDETPSLEIWRQTGGKAEVLKPGSTVHAFDSLQIAYLAAGRTYGMIVSLDGRGRLTLHFPDSFNAEPVLDQGAPTVLGFAYQLDDAPRFERFFFVTSRERFQVNTVWTQLEKQFAGSDVPAAWAGEAIPNLPAGFDVSSFLLKK